MAGTNSQFALEAVRLTKFYGEHPALRNVEFALPAGTVLALLGHNGAGKTTLLHLLALLTRPTSGQVRLGGEEIQRAGRTPAKAKIGLLGHQTFLYDELTARENLAFYARFYGLGRAAERVEEQLEAAGLAEVGDVLARHYSRGMRQRLALARTFLHDPAILLLDEPYTGLDELATAALRQRLGAFRDAGKTIVLSSHDVGLAMESATHTLVLERGRVKEFVAVQSGGRPEARSYQPAPAGEL